MCSSIAQPTSLRENKSSTPARYSTPSSVRNRVMSTSHLRLGASAAKSRPSTLVAGVGQRRWLFSPGEVPPSRSTLPAASDSLPAANCTAPHRLSVRHTRVDCHKCLGTPRKPSGVNILTKSDCTGVLIVKRDIAVGM
jgi:hypothetical protein